MLAALLPFLLPSGVYLHMPSVDSFPRHDPSDVTILPEGRLLTPAGRATPVARNPYGLALSPDGTRAFVASDGKGQWLDDWRSDAKPKAQPAEGGNTGACAFSADGRTLYWGSGEKGGVKIVDAATGETKGEISLDGTVGAQTFRDSYVNDLALSPDGRTLYCADVTNFRLAVLDVPSRNLVASIPTGRYPYALTLSGDRVFVANIGQFEYAPIPPPAEGKGDPRGLSFPPFAYPSREAEEGVEREGRLVPGLGKPLVDEAFSVYGYSVADRLHPRRTSVTRTGTPVGGRIVGGSGPSFVLAAGDSVYVSNSNDDTIDEIDARTGRIVGRIALEPSPLVRGLKGVQPTGLALSPDGRRLYVAEAGLNAIGVVDRASRKLVGMIPTAWYPYRLALTPDGGTLAAICFKGYGNGANAGRDKATDAFAARMGSFHAIPVPSDAELPRMTETVRRNNGLVDARADLTTMSSPVWSPFPGKRSDAIRTVVFITKENHTFDAIFDRVPGTANDPALLRWGLDQRIAAQGQPTLEHVAVMTNHNALAREFALSDNFYMEPEASGVGHRWLVGIQPNNFCQMLYTLGWDFKLKSAAKGRLASFGSNGGMAPEDYPEAGSMWDHLKRGGISLRNYGEGFEFAGVEEGEDEERTGAREVTNIPMPASLYDDTSRDFPIFNMNIPDNYRFEWFRDEIRARYLKGKYPFPSFLNVTLCNDHGTGPKPKKGYPYVASWMADNDLALGRMVEFLSHTPQWKHMLILVTEDDSGGEPDHIDAQRSVLLAISPYVKRRYVSHRHTTITSLHRTLYEVFGLPPLNLFDAVSNDFADVFTDKPDLTPYTAEAVDRRLFDWPRSRSKTDPDYQIARRTATIERDAFDRPEARRKR